MNSQVHEAWTRRLAACLFGAALAIHANWLPAAPINYGDFGPDYPPGVTMFLDVTESSGTDPVPPGRYGPPEINGDSLDFDPTEFVAFASGGGMDITDVQLNFTLMSLPLTGVTSILIGEEGDFSLWGSGTALTTVAAALSISIDILEVDGVPLASPLNYFDSDFFAADLANDGPVLLAPWSNSLFVDLLSILDSNEIEHEWGVSKAEIVINNQLIATSEPSSLAFIAKKDFTITTNVIIDPDFTIPEPSTLALMIIALAGFGAVFRRRLLRARR
jgi:hypothetical protein